MGGHGHGDHHEEYKVPKPEIYKVEDAPELLYVKEELAKRGLKDPWLRNEVWRYDHKIWGPPRTRGMRMFLFRGFRVGLAAFLATIAFEEYFGIYKDQHGHGDAAHGAGQH